MTDDGAGWGRFDAAVRSYIAEFAAASAQVEPELIARPEWAQRGNRYVRQMSNTYFMAQSIANQAFHFKTFHALEPLFYESPLKRYLPGAAPIGPGAQTYVHPRDVSIRIAFRAIEVHPDGTQTFDEDSMEADLASLHELVESDIVRMELLGVIVGAQVLETIRLQENLVLAPLTPTEAGTFLSPAPFPITVNQGSQEWEVLLPAPIAALRLSFEQPRAEPVADHLPTLFAEFEWIADAIALHYEVRPSLFLWRQWMADEFLRGGHSTSAPMGIGLVEKSEMLKDTAGVVQAYGAIRKLVLSGKQANVPLAIRRLGLTRTRIVSEDVLIDTMIALEALLLSDEGRDELALRMSLRAAQWSALLGENAPEVFDLLSRAYSLRSRVVHGKSPKKDSTFEVDGATLSYEDVISRVARIARKFGVDALKRVLDGDLDMQWRLRLKTLVESVAKDPE